MQKEKALKDEHPISMITPGIKLLLMAEGGHKNIEVARYQTIDTDNSIKYRVESILLWKHKSIVPFVFLLSLDDAIHLF